MHWGGAAPQRRQYRIDLVSGHGDDHEVVRRLLVQRVSHPHVGPLAVEYSVFAVDGRPDLSLVIYNPATAADAAKVRSLMESTPTRERP